MNIYHRYFVQYMLQNGISTVNNAFAYCKHVSQGNIENVTQFKNLITEINREVSKQFYKIVFSVCEVTNQNLVVWLNTKNDDISKCQISFSAIELEYFDAILKEILNAEEHRITFITCINISSSLTSQFSRDSGQNVLNKWIKGGYYVKRGDYIHLGPRTMLEFTAYLRSNCPDSICNLCSEIVFTGKTCSHCDKILHSYCLTTYLHNQSVCPCCHNDWMLTAEDQAEGDDDDHMDTNNVFTMETNGVLLNGSQSAMQTQESDSDIDESGPSTSKKRHR